MLSYEEYIEQLKQRIHDEFDFSFDWMKLYPKGYTSDDPMVKEWILKSNRMYCGTMDDETLGTDILAVERMVLGRYPCALRMNVEGMYKETLEKGFDEPFENVRFMHEESMKYFAKDNPRFSKNVEYEKVKPSLIIRPLNIHKYRKELEGRVYRVIGDVALVLYALIADYDRNTLTSKIWKNELKAWGMQGKEEEVIDEALANTARLYPAVVFDQTAYAERELMSNQFSKKTLTGRGLPLLLSTAHTVNGAAALFYPGVIDKLKEIMGGKFVAVFMNTSDVMIFDVDDPRSCEYAETASLITKFGEPLSTKLYRFTPEGFSIGIRVKYDPEAGKYVVQA